MAAQSNPPRLLLTQGLSRAQARAALARAEDLARTGSADTMVVTFGAVPVGARTGPVKRQDRVRRGAQRKIYFEGVIG